ncbi:tetratricopeptide repeat protein [Streptomyces sp. NPDC092952]|uniref:tetratricopeptide repeat protein n=1 Tax=Streptomyces sp. NPDC092952 TaxID=3366018 RepID=UPI00382485A7
MESPYAGDHEQALATAREAVLAQRELAAQQPDSLRPELAEALGTLSDRLTDAGDPEGALAPAQECARLYAGLAVGDPEAFKADLALSLDTLANRTAATGDGDTAAQFAGEAVRLQRELAADRRTATLLPLARFLLSSAAHHASSTGSVAALPLVEEAVGILQRIVPEDSDPLRPELAAALNVLGTHRAQVGDVSGALDATRRALAVYRDLAARRPDAFRPGLAGTLSNLAGCLNTGGDPGAGRPAAEESVALHRELAAQNPVAHRPALATALDSLARSLAGSGSPEEALAPAEEAVRILRELSAGQDGVFPPELARALLGLSGHRGLAHDDEGAVGAAREALAAYRSLALRLPDAFENSLVAAVTALSGALVRTGDHASAVRAFDETVAEFASDHPAVARRLGVERSVFLLNLPGPRAAAGMRELAAFLGRDDESDLVTVRARRALRAHGDIEAVSAAWKEETFAPVPAWLTLSQETLELVGSWMFAPDWPHSRDIWSRNADVLGGEEASTALEELACLDLRTAHRHAVLREAVLVYGVTAAYDPLILAEQVAEWVDCAGWAESRAFLEENPRLLRAQPPESTPLAHVAVLAVARDEGLDAAYRLVEDRTALQAYVERALAAGDGNALMHAAAVEGQVFDDKLSSLTHAQAGMVLSGVVEGIEPSDLAVLLPRAPEEIRVRLLEEIQALGVRYAHPHGESWLRIAEVLTGSAAE